MIKTIGLILLVLSTVLTAEAGLGMRPPFPQPPPHEVPPGPPGPPGWNNDIYGPARTVRWDYVGAFRTEKFLETRVDINVRDQFVNEVMVAAEDNDVEVVDAVAYLSNGQAFQLRNMIGVIQRGRQYQVQLDWRNSLRLSRLSYTIKSPNLIGSRATLHLQLGLAY